MFSTVSIKLLQEGKGGGAIKIDEEKFVAGLINAAIIVFFA